MLKTSVAAWIAATSSVTIMISTGVAHGAPWDLALSAWIAATIAVAVAVATDRVERLVQQPEASSRNSEDADLLVALSIARSASADSETPPKRIAA